MILSSSVTQFFVYLDVFLSLHMQITKTRNDQLPHQTVFPSGFPHSARSITIFAGHPGLCVDHIRFYPSRRPLSLISLQMLPFCFSVLVLCFSSPWPHASPVALKLSSRDPWESPRLFQGVRGSNDFHDKFRVLFAFFAFSHKHRVDFSRAHMSCDVTTN